MLDYTTYQSQKTRAETWDRGILRLPYGSKANRPRDADFSPPAHAAQHPPADLPSGSRSAARGGTTLALLPDSTANPKGNYQMQDPRLVHDPPGRPVHARGRRGRARTRRYLDAPLRRRTSSSTAARRKRRSKIAQDQGRRGPVGVTRRDRGVVRFPEQESPSKDPRGRRDLRGLLPRRRNPLRADRPFEAQRARRVHDRFQTVRSEKPPRPAPHRGRRAHRRDGRPLRRIHDRLA